ncbi:MAG: hypothetical protein C0469_02960 [Cyanobacteria bacterium DS2.3.42]|nr:hypothetical protein [Cyanobacteria bacterium DS2.3.42]
MMSRAVFTAGSRLCVFVLAALMSAATSSCTEKPKASMPKTSITVVPPSVTVHPLKNIPSKKHTASAYEHEVARTDWLFTINTELDFSIVKEEKQKDGYHLWIEITGVKLKLALPIATSISDKAPEYVVLHEQGHASICRRIYASSRQYALDAANSVIGKRVEGFGSDRKLALSNALQIAGQEVASPYKAKTAAVADKVSSIYDQLCQKEDRRNLVEKTIEEAFAAVEKEEKR